MLAKVTAVALVPLVAMGMWFGLDTMQHGAKAPVMPNPPSSATSSPVSTATSSATATTTSGAIGTTSRAH